MELRKRLTALRALSPSRFSKLWTIACAFRSWTSLSGAPVASPAIEVGFGVVETGGSVEVDGSDKGRAAEAEADGGVEKTREEAARIAPLNWSDGRR